MTRGLAVLCVAAGALLVLPAAALACANEQSRPEMMSVRSYARTVECVVNEQRVRAGLRALRHDRRLSRAARRYSNSMVRQGFFAHVSPQGSTLGQRARNAGYRGSKLGETIGWASGTLATPAAIVQAWMDSPPHRSIIMDGSFRKLGLGVATGSPAGVQGASTVTADFGT